MAKHVSNQATQVDELSNEKNDLKLTIALRCYTIKKNSEKRLTVARRRSAICETRVAYLETQNLGLRGELIANEVQHLLEDDETDTTTKQY